MSVSDLTGEVSFGLENIEGNHQRIKQLVLDVLDTIRE
jgi:hypothetical protein